MHPYVLDTTLFGIHILLPSYGVMLALAFSTAYFISLHRAAKLGDDPKHIENLFLLIVLGSVFGSRFFHVVFEEPQYYAAHPEKIIAVWEGGYTLYGALLVSIGMVWMYSRGKKIDYFNFSDIAALATAAGIGVGRIGCFLAGCCWGKATQCFLGVKFNHPQTFANVRNVSVHPSQLYESAGCFLIFGYLWWRFEKREYRGQIFFQGLVLYSILRFFIEYFRGDDYRGYVFSGLLSYSQLVSLGILPFAIAGIVIYRKKNASARR